MSMHPTEDANHRIEAEVDGRKIPQDNCSSAGAIRSVEDNG